MASSTAPHRRSQEKKTDQLTDIAVNLKGWAMVDGMRRRKGNEIICARPINSKPSADLISLHQKSGIPLAETFRSSSKYTPEEPAPLSAFTRHYLVVGYAPRYPTVELLERNPVISYPKKVGQERPGNVTGWKKDEPPILVVADISSKKREKTQLWALLCPKDGLCTPYQINRKCGILSVGVQNPSNGLQFEGEVVDGGCQSESISTGGGGRGRRSSQRGE
jgi:hypothetical protein